MAGDQVARICLISRSVRRCLLGFPTAKLLFSHLYKYFLGGYILKYANIKLFSKPLIYPIIYISIDLWTLVLLHGPQQYNI